MDVNASIEITIHLWNEMVEEGILDGIVLSSSYHPSQKRIAQQNED